MMLVALARWKWNILLGSWAHWACYARTWLTALLRWRSFIGSSVYRPIYDLVRNGIFTSSAMSAKWHVPWFCRRHALLIDTLTRTAICVLPSARHAVCFCVPSCQLFANFHYGDLCRLLGIVLPVDRASSRPFHSHFQSVDRQAVFKQIYATLKKSLTWPLYTNECCPSWFCGRFKELLAVCRQQAAFLTWPLRSSRPRPSQSLDVIVASRAVFCNELHAA